MIAMPVTFYVQLINDLFRRRLFIC